jgi:SAM-dependent methyltransferase
VSSRDKERFARAVDQPLRDLGLAAPGDRWERSRLYWALHRRVTRLVFERRMDTAGTAIELEHFDAESVAYGPSSWLPMRWALRQLRPCSKDVFVDFGCGKGRVVCEAARRPFGRVVGVEISDRLLQTAERNVERNRRRFKCQDIELVCVDASKWDVPDDMSVGYFFYPFVGATFRGVIDNIRESVAHNPRTVRLVYVCPKPELEDYILSTEAFRLVNRRRGRGARGQIVNSVALYEHDPTSK